MAPAAGFAGLDHGLAILGAIELDFLVFLHFSASYLSAALAAGWLHRTALTPFSRSNGAGFRRLRPRFALPSALDHKLETNFI
jgi:hypothetical protein